ncbi:MAG: 16S rRNA (adenine(1518)-N(6)/adenine(1519)-N(6))-dimethyltransferase RsmA [Candidatus Omnitrophota bacterium]
MRENRPLRPKKRLGQNFLVDKNIRRKIVDSCGFKPGDTVIEIGAGRGELTGLIAKRVKFIYALEFDTDLCGILKEALAGYPNIKIINQDIIKTNFNIFAATAKTKLMVVGNIPYYITTPIIKQLLFYRKKIKNIFLTVQKEFARRVTASAGSKEYGSLTCFLNYYLEPRILFIIKKSSFLPAPKVDSCFLSLSPRKPPVKVKDEELFFNIIRSSFAKRRKTLRNSLEGVVSEQDLDMFFKKYGIDRNIRPEDLRLEDFARLTNHISHKEGHQPHKSQESAKRKAENQGYQSLGVSGHKL